MKMNKSKIPVIIDTDPGIDDAAALAIAVSSQQLDIKLISAAAGNVGVDRALENILRLLAFFDKKIPVARGNQTPLIRDLKTAANIHGQNGLGGYQLPDPDFSLLVKESSVEKIHQILTSSPQKVTLIGIAPLTNYALLLKAYPNDCNKIKEFVLMGGAWGRGNFNVLTEFNFGVDPQAAKIVTESDVPIKIAPLEAGKKALIKPEISNQIKHFGKVGRMLFNLFKAFRGGSFETGLKIYDALAVGILLQPEMFKFQTANVKIEISGTYTSGASLFDLKGYLPNAPTAEIIEQVDENQFSNWFLGELRRWKNIQ
jgi:inosine-uridine nucleoside N-ribohydrolase